MIIKHFSLDNCIEARGWVVAIDVIRAFSTAAYAFGGGAAQILCTDNTTRALELKQSNSGSLAMGEESDGLVINAFELNNSPMRLMEHDVRGKTIIQRTTAGTPGLVRPQYAQVALACSLVNVGATIRYILQHDPAELDLIETGILSDGRGDEDIACADYIESVIKGQPLPLDQIIYRVMHSEETSFFTSADSVNFPLYDLDLVCMVDRFDFVMRAERISHDCVRLLKIDTAS